MLFVATLLVSIAIGDPPVPSWVIQPKATAARLRGVSAPSVDVVWASGTQGTFARTIDGGKSWAAGQVPGGEGLDFRDVHAVDGGIAYLLSSGPGDESRIYKTLDGGASWRMQLTNPDQNGFLDAIAFFDARRGLALGDPVDGRFQVFATTDGGEGWKRIPSTGMPPALPAEGAFAASGTCLVTMGDRHAWFATGGASVSRVFRSEDAGLTWTAAETPVRAGNPSSGIFSLAFVDATRGFAIGGDYKSPELPGPFLARTTDGGKSWSLLADAPRGYRSGLAVVKAGDGSISCVAVGPGGSNRSWTDSARWSSESQEGFHAVDSVWAVGDSGRIAKLLP